jgi:hypothetical protein
MPTDSEKILGLVEAAHEDLHRPDLPLSAVITKAARVARLQGDDYNLFWLEMELRPIGDTASSHVIEAELKRVWGEDDFARMRTSLYAQYFKRREMEKKEGEEEAKICAMSVGQIEAQISMLKELSESYKPDPGLHPVDLYHEAKGLRDLRTQTRIMARDLEWVLEKIRSHVGTYLSESESQLRVGRAASDIFEENRLYVDRRLGAVSGKALAQLAAAYERQAASDPESGSHAVTSCRRVLKSLADALYPATDEEVEGYDGMIRKMTEDRFISRLMQFAGERVSSSGSRSLIQARLSDLAARLDALNQVSSKGVHDDVTSFEVNQCVIQTYLLAGDLLRLQDP